MTGAPDGDQHDRVQREGLWQRMIAEFTGKRRAQHPDRTRDLIREAEATRRDLVALTARLAAHVADLQQYAREYARKHERSP